MRRYSLFINPTHSATVIPQRQVIFPHRFYHDFKKMRYNTDTVKTEIQERNVVIMKKSKAAACICAVIMAVSGAAALSAYADDTSSSGAASSAAAAESSEKTAVTNAKYGKVTAVNGSELTVSLGEFTKKEKTSSDSGTTDESAVKSKKRTDSSSGTDSGTSAKKKTSDSSTDTDSTSSGTAESGKKRKGKGGHKGSFTENGTTLTVKLTDSVTIEKKGQAAEVSDISEGDMIKIVYDDSGNLTEIKLIKGHKTRSQSDSAAAEKEA